MNVRRGKTLLPAVSIISVSTFAAFLPGVMELNAAQISYLTLIVLAIAISIVSYQIHVFRRPRQLSRTTSSGTINLVDSINDSRKFDYSRILAESRRVTICLNDGKSWVEAHEQELSVRIKDSRLKTTVILCHPESPMIEILARKESKDPEEVKNKIIFTVEKLVAMSGHSKNLEVLGHSLINPSSIVLGDSSAVVTPYLLSRGKRIVPAFVYAEGTSGGYFREIVRDFEQVRIDCERLDHFPSKKLAVVQ